MLKWIICIILLIMSHLYVAWRKSIRIVFRLPSQTHNNIVSNLGRCIIERLDRRLTKYI